ncbi:hypothetical protein [Microbacterium sp. A1-JK]|uniref:hypothetical protein n=1 Tax=Microbacterium sp. A1-JK TaxID=3177516 RepID=UPI00388A2CDD
MSFPLILASGPVAPPVAGSPWSDISLTWIGPDGSVWDLRDWRSGVFVTRDGIEGLHFPKVTRAISRSGAIPGHRVRGWRAEARDVFWRTFVWADASEEWLERYEAFFATLHPLNAGRWIVQPEGRPARSVELTAVLDDSYSYERDPYRAGWAEYPITLEAAQPFWQGERVRRGPWRAPDTQDFFPGPPFTISSSSAFGSASIPNAGDVDAWGVWWAVGPLTSIELGIGEAVIRPPFELLDGEMLRIDTDPRHPTALLGPATVDGDGQIDTDSFVGSDVTRDLGLQDYAAVPPGGSVDLHVEATGSGSVLFDLVPLHFRAF